MIPLSPLLDEMNSGGGALSSAINEEGPSFREVPPIFSKPSPEEKSSLPSSIFTFSQETDASENPEPLPSSIEKESPLLVQSVSSIEEEEQPLSTFLEKKKKIDSDLFETSYFPGAPHSVLLSSLSLSAPSLSPSEMPPEILSFFDRICGEMIVMTSEHSNKTTLVLNSEAFSSSPFYGAEITIEEFSTAPKIFNVTISADPKAIELIQSHLMSFWEIFQERKFSFSINRIDMDLLSKPDFSRKSEEDQGDLDHEQKDKRHS